MNRILAATLVMLSATQPTVLTAQARDQAHTLKVSPFYQSDVPPENIVAVGFRVSVSLVPHLRGWGSGAIYGTGVACKHAEGESCDSVGKEVGVGAAMSLFDSESSKIVNPYIGAGMVSRSGDLKDNLNPVGQFGADLRISRRLGLWGEAALTKYHRWGNTTLIGGGLSVSF